MRILTVPTLLGCGIRCYSEHLVGEGDRLGAIIVAGDFSAHLGCLGGPRGVGEPNQPGLIVKDFIDLDFFTGQNYTFWNSVSETTVDYILSDCEVSCSMTRCCTLECASLNTSDHLPITAKFCFNDIPSSSHAATDKIKVNRVTCKGVPMSKCVPE